MTTRARFRQTERLERLAQPYLRPKEQADSRFEEMVRSSAFTHTANLSALILYGDPKIDEPLSFAWRRCLDSAEWQKRREKYGGWDEYGRDDCGNPFVDFAAGRIADYFCKYFLPDLRGTDELEKFGLIFKNASPWLLWFTYADADARILGINLPDLSAVKRFIRDTDNFGKSHLPLGPFECRLRADAVEDQIAIWTQKVVEKMLKHETNGVTPRERKRMASIREKYGDVSNALPDRAVITKIAVLHLLTCISGLNHFERWLNSADTTVRR
jgi:hypothetical protein